MELLAVLGAFRHQRVPPTMNLRNPDPECDLDYVPEHSRPASVNTALSNSFAFGGANAVLVLRKYSDV